MYSQILKSFLNDRISASHNISVWFDKNYPEYKNEFVLFHYYKGCSKKYLKLSNIDAKRQLIEKCVDENLKHCKICNIKLNECKILSVLSNRAIKYCSEQCRNKAISLSQSKNNSCYAITTENWKKHCKKRSETMKNKIKNGEFTPKSTNYRTYKKIEVHYNNINYSFRSSWEALFLFLNQDKNLQFEKIRLRYYDTELNLERIYITDFYDPVTNTIYEIKPSKYCNQNFLDKKKSVIDNNYNFVLINEEYFKQFKYNLCETDLNNFITNFSDIKNRFSLYIKRENNE